MNNIYIDIELQLFFTIVSLACEKVYGQHKVFGSK